METPNYYRKFVTFADYAARVNEKLVQFPISGGSEKQNAWATKIRNEYTQANLASLNPDNKLYIGTDEQREAFKVGTIVIAQVVDAKKWIDLHQAHELTHGKMYNVDAFMAKFNLKTA